MTTCRKCGVTDPACGFYDREKRCKDCRRSAMRALYGEHNPRPPESDGVITKRREAQWSRRGIKGFTSAQRLEMHERQASRCAICGEEHARLDLDHDHATGKVRALLCRNCNMMLGNARDDVATLAAAIAYLNHHSVPEGRS